MSLENLIKKGALACLLLLGNNLSAQDKSRVYRSTSKEMQAPWLTGSLMAPVGTTVPAGSSLIKSHIYWITNTGSYNKNWQAIPANRNLYTLNTQFLWFFGLTSSCDINMGFPLFYKNASCQHFFYCGDLMVGLDLQLMAVDFNSYLPAIKLAIREVFPTGNFQNFRPRKLWTEQTGAGTFATQFDLIFYKVVPLYDLHWLSMTFSAQYTINTPLNVHGFNAYGGGFGTRGRVFPGSSFQGILSFELTLNQNWVLALDSVYTHTNKSPFLGWLPGISIYGTVAKPEKSSSEQLSFAPAIEYNFSKDFGVIAGYWFSLLGRNSTQFQSGTVNIKYTY